MRAPPRGTRPSSAQRHCATSRARRTRGDTAGCGRDGGRAAAPALSKVGHVAQRRHEVAALRVLQLEGAQHVARLAHARQRVEVARGRHVRHRDLQRPKAVVRQPLLKHVKLDVRRELDAVKLVHVAVGPRVVAPGGDGRQRLLLVAAPHLDKRGERAPVVHAAHQVARSHDRNDDDARRRGQRLLLLERLERAVDALELDAARALAAALRVGPQPLAQVVPRRVRRRLDRRDGRQLDQRAAQQLLGKERALDVQLEQVARAEHVAVVHRDLGLLAGGLLHQQPERLAPLGLQRVADDLGGRRVLAVRRHLHKRVGRPDHVHLLEARRLDDPDLEHAARAVCQLGHLHRHLLAADDGHHKALRPHKHVDDDVVDHVVDEGLHDARHVLPAQRRAKVQAVLVARRLAERDHRGAKARDGVHQRRQHDAQRPHERNVRHARAHLGELPRRQLDGERDVGLTAPPHVHLHHHGVVPLVRHVDRLDAEGRVAKRELLERDLLDARHLHRLELLLKDALRHLLDHLAHALVVVRPHLLQHAVEPRNLLALRV
mmetsp:Transcript_29096/g.74244  ORF Transcript_29096/g.74244 Transcript_29096/m.74244 type:complete len:547 (-) Transcript_29096:931-2571(-)